MHTYYFDLHPRDLDHPQFEWSFQRQLFDALHDYFMEMFIRTPQDRADRQRRRACERASPKDRAGNPRARPDSLLALHGAVPLRRELGYYSRNAAQFGKAGDFYTSSDVHAVFGRLLARQFDEMWRVLGSPEQIIVVELGPGRGLFAQDVLDWSEKKFPEFFQRSSLCPDRTLARVAPGIEATLSRHLAREGRD